MELQVGGKENPTPRRPTKVIVWDKYREIADGIQDDFDAEQIAQQLCAAAKKATEKRHVADDTPDPDMHLLSLWDRRLQAIQRYRKDRRKRDLEEANKLTKEAKEYARELDNCRWLELC